MIELLTGLTEREAELIQLEDVAGLGGAGRPFFRRLARRQDAIAGLALRCHWPPSELQCWTLDDVRFWQRLIPAPSRPGRVED